MDHLVESDRLRRDLKHYRAELSSIVDPRDAKVLIEHISEIETRLRTFEHKQRSQLWALSDSDIWRSALGLINRHGIAAPDIAGQHIAALSEENHFDGAAVWRRIRRATGELRRIKPKIGERIH
jgi:hypothetical protein